MSKSSRPTTSGMDRCGTSVARLCSDPHEYLRFHSVDASSQLMRPHSTTTRGPCPAEKIASALRAIDGINRRGTADAPGMSTPLPSVNDTGSPLPQPIPQSGVPAIGGMGRAGGNGLRCYRRLVILVSLVAELSGNKSPPHHI